jgi:CRISPR system Cascade subunit CasD
MTARLTGLALRLHGPLQAWGGSVVGDDRPTLGFPTRSGVLGLIAACMGIQRAETPRLIALADGSRVHVRVDAAGEPLVDDQTIQDNPNASETRQTIQSKRTYLCDASFAVVVVPGPAASLDEMADAITRPVFSPFLGRRACVPSSPMLLAPRIEANDPVGLFEDIEAGPPELLDALRKQRRGSSSAFADFYLDVPEHPSTLRRIPVRDHLAGPLPRQFRERFALHVRIPTAAGAAHS